MAELLRLEGEFVLASAFTGASEIAEKTFMESIAIARREGTRSWELRTAMSLARLLCAENRADEARTILGEIYDRFDEGFGTADLRTAGAMIEKLSRRQ